MSLDLTELREAVAREGRVARVVIAEGRGSVPREQGASMLVWETGASGSIGGGALEHTAMEWSRESLVTGPRFDRIPLGPALGQCCGGAVGILTEVFDTKRLDAMEGIGFARPLPGCETPMPISLAAMLKAARAGEGAAQTQLLDGWFFEPFATKSQTIWIWGAGHVGRALIACLGPLPDFAITWVDSAPQRFPEDVPAIVTALPAPNMPAAMALAPKDAHHLILTFSHEIDLELCHAALRHGFASCGLIGSATKWSRFQRRLRQLGHETAQISRIACPIGDPSLGKHPQAIAIGVSAALIKGTAGQFDQKTISGQGEEFGEGSMIAKGLSSKERAS